MPVDQTDSPPGGYLVAADRVPDGRKSFIHASGPWRPTRYEGAYRGGVRDGIWWITDAEIGDPRWETTWLAGERHGRSRVWHRNSQLEHEGHSRTVNNRANGRFGFRMDR